MTVFWTFCILKGRRNHVREGTAAVRPQGKVRGYGEKIEIRLFGTPAILADGEPVGFPYKKVEGFLYYLCVKKQITREEAICLLWGDEDEASGRKKLRDAIYQVRKKLNKDIILTAGHTGIALNPACPVSIDWDHVKKGHLGEQKPFLEYFYIKKCLEFEEWVGGIRAMQSEESVKNASGKFREAERRETWRRSRNTAPFL